jgi:predicted DNA-binding transcriptional regulator YafY
MVREGAETGYLPNSSHFMKEFEVSRRTVARDLDFLRDEERAPLAYDDARHGFHLTDKTYTLPPVRISRKEAFSFGLARKLLAHYEGTPLHMDMRSVLDKIAESLEGDITIEPDWLSEHVGVMPEDCVRIDPEVWAQIAGFIERREEIRATYQTFDGRISEYTLRPYHLLAYHGNWYVFAWNTAKERVATFALSRFRHIESTGARFAPPAGFRSQGIREECLRDHRRREAHQGPATVRAKARGLHHGTAVAPVTGFPYAAGWSRRDALRDHWPQAGSPLDTLVDAGREGAGTEKPA